MREHEANNMHIQQIWAYCIPNNTSFGWSHLFSIVCVHTYLYTYSQELASKSSALMDLNEDSENEEEDFDNWLPDPVDADPS